MAQPADTFDRYDLIGVREDLSDVISNISPTDTPFMSNIGKASCDNSQFDWQTDSLAAAAANATIEGDDTAAQAVAATTRYINYTQIYKKAFTISGTAERVKKAAKVANDLGSLAPMIGKLFDAKSVATKTSSVFRVS